MNGDGTRRRAAWFWAIPLVSTPVLFLLMTVLAKSLFGVALEGPGWIRELLLELLLGFVLLAFSRRGWLFVIVQALLMAMLTLGAAAKIAVWGWPPRPEEILALPELVRIVPPLVRLALLAPPVLMLVLVILNFKPRRAGLVAVAGLVAMVACVRLAPGAVVRLLDAGLEHSAWNEAQNYVARGPLLYFLSAECHARLDRPRPPAREALEGAIRRLERRAAALGPAERSGKPRNLYVVVLESFWDPSPLTAARFDRPPLDPAFLALWDRAGRSHALSGEFGGATANPELEILCGLPARALFPGVAFKGAVTHDMPCLPRLLGEAGWKTAAFHANVPDFWNRRWAYARIGFGRFFSKLDLEMDDRNGPYLDDASLYRQALAWEAGTSPVFRYMMTITGHWPYELAPAHATELDCHSKVKEVCAYARLAAHTSKELAAFVDTVLREDPGAVIVALGDHLPVLGAQLAGYQESGLVSTTWVPSMTGRELAALSSVPLLVVDGRRGPLPLGTVAQFELPRTVLRLLGRPVPYWMQLLRPPEGLHVRPLAQGFFVVPDSGEPVSCMGSNTGPVCREAGAWLQDAVIVGREMLLGDPSAVRPPAAAMTGG